MWNVDEGEIVASASIVESVAWARLDVTVNMRAKPNKCLKSIIMISRIFSHLIKRIDFFKAEFLICCYDFASVKVGRFLDQI